MAFPPDTNRIQPEHLPTPFSAADIRTGCPAGRTIHLQNDVPGGEPTFLRIRFVEVDADGAVQEFQPTDREGRPIGEPTRRHSSWLDLQHHASQPASTTVIDEVDLELPFGTEPCATRSERTTDLPPSGSPRVVLACPFRSRSGWAASLSAARS
jgi:hypothetical protein